jgi:hypothetical protein
LQLDGKPFVAKQFCEVGNGPECVSPSENATQLENEFVRLKEGQWFLDQFYSRADEMETEVSTSPSFNFSGAINIDLA